MADTRDVPSRRDFLSASATSLGGAWLVGLGPWLERAALHARRAAASGLPFVVFSEREAADFEAFSARVIPTDDTPGAREAGAVHFADRALAEVFDFLVPIVRPGLAALNERVAATHPGTAAFADLADADQDALMEVVEQEDPGFFFFARTLVALGTVTMPMHGGNRDKVGWRILGFEDTWVHQPPFGFYDRDEHGGEGDR